MNIFDRYVIRSIFLSTVLFLTILLSLYGFIALADAIKYVGKGSFNLTDAFYYTALSLPRRMYDLFPFSVLLGGLIGLGNLNSNNELVAFRAAGVSIGRLLVPVMHASFILTLLMFFIGEFVVPVTEKSASTLWTVQVHGVTTNISKEYIWVREKNNFIKFNSILERKKLKNIDIYTFNDDKTLKVHSHAQSAYYDGNDWVLKNIKQIYFTENKIVSNRIKLARWPTLISLEIVDVIASNLENISASGLYHYAKFLDANHLDSRNYWLFFWNKIISPFSIAVMLLLAAPLVFDSSRTSNVGNRLMIGVTIGISFTMANKLVAQFGLIYNVSPLISASVITLASMIIAIFLIRRIF